MAAMTSKFNFDCMIQYFTDQWSTTLDTKAIALTIKPRIDAIRTLYIGARLGRKNNSLMENPRECYLPYKPYRVAF